ncbi:MAG: ABC transporter permease [Bryobacteraceae bacterium]|nr:ABC transporter permease [Bryobacteraceae bacterium]MCX7603286.1 ABC transporter permease [Bryobacteraceae bacterium]
MTRFVQIQEAFGIAIANLRAAKLRSALTLLGIILSTTTLIAVMAVIHGMDVYVAEKIADLGANGFTVVRFAFIGDWDPKKFLELLRKNPELRPDEYEFIRERATLLKEIGMSGSTRGDVSYGNQRLEEVRVIGATANFNLINSVQVESGRYLSEGDVHGRRMVAFIGADVRDQFFEGLDPVGKIVRVNGKPYEVVGVARRLGSVFGQSQDNFVHIPLYTFFKEFGSRRWISFNCLAVDRPRFQDAMDEVRSLLRAYRRLPPQREDNFMMFTSDSIMGAWDRLTGAIAATAMAVVSVFMVVGGVVIMNIMLAVVTERTQEIGIRKSLGARRSDILWQFLIESAVLAGAGGLIGVLLAWGVAIAVRNLTPIPMVLPMYSIVLGVGLSSAVGLFFGIYPARQAARLDPIEALRAEK